MSHTVADVIKALELAYPPEYAEDWDAIGLVCGDPAATVERVLICVDPTEETVSEALERGVQLIIAHHPLMLRGVHGVPADQPKGRLIHRLLLGGCALYCAHTNADIAVPGVSDALAETIGLRVRSALRPHPTATDATPLLGSGRVGELPETEPFSRFVRRVADALPATSWGVRGSGDPDRPIRTVAVCGGAGDSYLGAAVALGVDAYVTGDLRHHPAAEHGALATVPGGRAPALVDIAHWAGEWPWCAQAARVVRAATQSTVEAHVSQRRTDPWNLHESSTSPRP
ncbi:Nif3-like dinuclear metal center hexameric protein [Actinoalloteichus hymeniacidonis]|uniref:GTP cyclohydrolase 1 type 2 homolog n=1 Tax=Actinoalloteichus hymeniacidonis TaxID=340345 RepID=A0AAC9HU64_9PSEU|nr:Nif3-like dinuclear metal center hexameric protein [Actinoalloteichus hymeniacidonis]AOS65201.1 dinuclear metal center protein, YbgI/SA1388 family [Actinoalloteichus hymeniacidonis]MBB5906719.1 dinuclear metal center YbgI/SA1388 family protein [Actinoalloteichus hymeniacidonis]